MLFQFFLVFHVKNKVALFDTENGEKSEIIGKCANLFLLGIYYWKEKEVRMPHDAAFHMIGLILRSLMSFSNKWGLEFRPSPIYWIFFVLFFNYFSPFLSLFSISTFSLFFQHEYPCNFCDQKFRDFNGRGEHYRSHASHPYLCLSCGANYPTLEELREHRRTEHEKSYEFVCDLCDKRWVNSVPL